VYVRPAVVSFNIAKWPLRLISLLQGLCFVHMSYLFGCSSVVHIYDSVQVHDCNCFDIGCEHQSFQDHSE